MMMELGDLAAATALFVGGHFALSSLPLRGAILARLGEGAFRGLYSLFAMAAFAWMILTYGAAPHIPVYQPPEFGRWLAVGLMPLACLCLVASFLGRNVTAVGGEGKLDSSDIYSPRGIYTITRHPMLTGTALWALAHLAANGDAASIILFAGILILSIGGAAHIDYRRAQLLGPAWGAVALTTSAIPFLAVAQRRCRLDLAGIGLVPVAGGLALYLALLLGHRYLAGVPLIQGLPF